ncbi:MAG: precorrin-6y C5,15-methyltransferase (decarboxylating) subunit CbiE [Isosphaeraceae bacterium]|nr:precorrin-6y C5,15-methyltransferase (decarboxylating) subunit CbiE [Isosphaeraceae bacterium]
MVLTVWVLGIGADGAGSLSARARTALSAATFVAGGRRHLELVGPTQAETFVIGDNIPALVDRLSRRGAEERCVVLASGDPLFYGVGRALSQSLGSGSVTVEPSLSSMQLAFARAGLAWDDAVIASVHGRPLADTLRPLLGRPKIGLFTHDGQSPAMVAAFFLEHGLDDYDAWVAENLGTPDERVHAFGLPELVGRDFADLNVLLLQRNGAASVLEVEGAAAGLDDSYFAQPDTGPVLLTHADVRAIVLARFRELPEGPIWDVGAGLGGVAVELARAFPRREVVAVERSAERLSYLGINRARFGAYNLRIVAGEAPEALAGEARPAAIFIGGSGGRLRGVLDQAQEHLLPSGRLVANFLGLENLADALAMLRSAAWRFSVTQVAVSHDQPLAGLTTLVPERPVWVVRAVRPAG